MERAMLPDKWNAVNRNNLMVGKSHFHYLRRKEVFLSLSINRQKNACRRYKKISICSREYLAVHLDRVRQRKLYEIIWHPARSTQSCQFLLHFHQLIMIWIVRLTRTAIKNGVGWCKTSKCVNMTVGIVAKQRPSDAGRADG